MTHTLTMARVEVEDPNSHYDYGLRDYLVNGVHIVGHSGDFGGMNSQLEIYLERGYTVAVLSNYDPVAAERVAQKARLLSAK
jgi:hypothetical protein